MPLGRMLTHVVVGTNGRREMFTALVDTGAGRTILSNAVARLLGMRTPKAVDYLELMGGKKPICFRTVDLHVPGTDCLVEGMRVSVVTKPMEDMLFNIILGADFLQRTGAVLDFRKGRHAIVADPAGRDEQPADFVAPRRLRLPYAGWFS